ncbi:MAG: AAA family ATPase, partial [Cytophagales bacterium]|nr:AAA family ATPase [Cytophagales bacterium]
MGRGGRKRGRSPQAVGRKDHYNPTLLLIEEPESHLHPKLQADLADFFAAASSRYNLQFAIETHSEYFIHKLR